MRCNASHYTKALSISPSKWTSCTYRVLVPTLWYYNNDSKDLLWCKKTTTCESHVRVHFLLRITTTPHQHLFTHSLSSKLPQEHSLAVHWSSKNHVGHNNHLQHLSSRVCLCGHIGTSSVHSRPISGRRSEHKIYTFIVDCSGKVLYRITEQAVGRCICLMLCRKRDGISI